MESTAFREVQFISQLKLETMPHDLKGKGIINKFFIYGDAMEPTIYHGDFVYASFVESKPFEIKDSFVYIVNSRSLGLIIKRLYLSDDGVKCVSDNTAHPDFTLPLDDILELWYFRRNYSAQVPPPTQPAPLFNEGRDLFATLTESGYFWRFENDEEGYYVSLIDRLQYPRVWRDNQTNGEGIEIIAETVENIENRLAPLAEKDWITRIHGTTIPELVAALRDIKSKQNPNQ